MDDAERERGPWHRNLIVLWFCTFVAGMAFSEIMPFLSLFVSQLGDFTKAQITFYSGLAFAADYAISAISAPLWGIIADKKGRKIMLLRASLGMAVAMGLMGFVTNVWQLVALRALQGVFAGFISNAQALVASQTPRKYSGRALSTLITGAVSGQLFGPVIGGLLAQLFSIRNTFFITAGLLMVAFLLSLFFVQEHFKPVAHHREPGDSRNPLAAFQNPRLIIVMLCSTAIVQFGNASIAPIISLYVRELMHYRGPITVVAGIIAALPGISNIFSAPRLGHYGDQHGSGKVLLFGYIFAVIMYFPQGIVTSVVALGILRFAIGISDGALYPEIQTVLTKNTPVHLTSTIFSYNQSFQAIGNMFGALLGGLVAGWFNYNAVFIMTALLLLINLGLILWLVPDIWKNGKRTVS
ncbi:Multidrug-efflux transporter major facilitatorsuperfamily [Lactiplantibacillus plantarum]|uniref:Multidrug-efflux transporter, major facilitator superfamily (MFS) n=1 Tax=Lactiplantibacillus plantarum CMPG5300 TaxID=1304889 RepID=A0AAW3FS87_LACPN|nr:MULTISPECIES: MFS transporter [Lactiplantibacillus]ALC07326.1 MFS family major facilitator transporter [Lactiplantibacillus plantarum]ARW15029.1 Multidrug resistance protein MdtG [Lactiplantibacillus plantarum subsp. plantarum]ATI70056.1 MFS transporter [Lactiplantibacillus plantarum]KGH44134.1 multidrug-efflux transporter, major facilitator superfamily (MFS) [Lactiplantibacillus plantarum CMPG5300]KZT97568.1 Multidrug-efflux transporter major facilitatorsuperfamily [Lactiplantibacillus pla